MTFAEAARRLGHRSRSTLYRLKADHRLNHYLVDGPDGSTLLELTPEGRPTLEAYLAAVLEPGRGPQTRRREQRSQRDRRWELVAANLSAALEEIGGPSLTGKEAELLVLHMGPATWPPGEGRKGSGLDRSEPLDSSGRGGEPVAGGGRLALPAAHGPGLPPGLQSRRSVDGGDHLGHGEPGLVGGGHGGPGAG